MPTEARWTFLTNHAHVLVCLARAPGARMREVAESVGITERAVQKIVADLEAGGFLVRRRQGRRNRYRIVTGVPLRHAVEANASIADLLAAVDRRPD
jgi:DNA-binding MarR family transcriptional regulator